MGYYSGVFQPRPALQGSAEAVELQRLLFHWPAVVAIAQGEWEQGFAKSIVAQSKRKNWHPSSKQIEIMRGMVSELFSQSNTVDQEGDIQLIE